MPRAIAKVGDTIIAETETWETVEGNIYYIFSIDIKITNEHPIPISYKGDASYYTITVGDKILPDAAWYYPHPLDAAKNIEGYVAFYKNKVDVNVE